jgi:hypothetical protein
MFVPVDGSVTKVTAKAVLYVSKAAKTEHWIPRSVIEDGDDIEEGEQEMLVAEWFLDKEGIPT